MNQQAAADKNNQQGKQRDTASATAPVDRHRKVLRTYGQKKAKADSAADNASTTLPSDFLALVGGKQ